MSVLWWTLPANCSGSDTQHTENCANGGPEVGSRFLGPVGPSFMPTYVTALHLLHQSEFPPEPSLRPPASLQPLCLSQALAQASEWKQNNRLLAWQKEWERRRGVSQEKVSVDCGAKQWLEKAEGTEAEGEGFVQCAVERGLLKYDLRAKECKLFNHGYTLTSFYNDWIK